jgi:hypothetical protein
MVKIIVYYENQINAQLNPVRQILGYLTLKRVSHTVAVG